MIALYALWGGICWVLRGGAFGAICRKFGFEPGTTITRIVCAGLLTAPLLNPFFWVITYIAMTIGYFGEAMGQERQPRDIAYMSAWGAVVGVIATISPWGLLMALAGPIYWLNHKIGNGRFDWTQRAEFLTGAALGCAFYLK